MTEESRRIVEGLKHCAEKYTICKGCPVRSDCEEFEAAGRRYVPIKALQVINELEEMLKEYRVHIFKATVAALKGTLDEEGEGDGDHEPFGTLPLGLKNMRDLLWGDNLPYKTQMFENGAVIAIPSFEPGRVASIVHTYTRWDDKRVRVCLTDAPGESVVCTPEEALKLIRRRLEYAGLI